MGTGRETLVIFCSPDNAFKDWDQMDLDKEQMFFNLEIVNSAARLILAWSFII